MKSWLRASHRKGFLPILVLVTMLLPGPMPVVHSHAAQLTSLQTTQLARHIASFHKFAMSTDTRESHRDERSIRDPLTSWHVHWVLRSSLFEGIPGDSSGCIGISLVSDQAANDGKFDAEYWSGDVSHGGYSLHGLYLDWIAFENQFATTHVCADRNKFAASFLHVSLWCSDQSLPEFLGVMRC